MPDTPLTPAQKASWNKFIDFVKAQGMSNQSVLDHRNKQVGMSLLQKFNYANPDNALPTTIVPQVQGELQSYRDKLVSDWKAGKAKIDGVKDESEIMGGISPVDGWAGSKTLNSKFPVATLTQTNDKGSTTKDFGTDLGAYDKAVGK